MKHLFLMSAIMVAVSVIGGGADAKNLTVYFSVSGNTERVANGNESLMQRIAEKNGLHTLEAAEKIGVGSRKYKLVDLDKE